MFIRSMYFRNEEELKLVKEFIAQMRGNQVQKIQSAPREESHQASADVNEATLTKAVHVSRPEQKAMLFSSSKVNTYEMPELPPLLLDVMNGGTFPAQGDLTRAEQAILYDNQINTLVNLYRQTKKSDLAQHIRQRLDEIGVDF